jgi:hypothetical protein
MRSGSASSKPPASQTSFRKPRADLQSPIGVVHFERSEDAEVHRAFPGRPCHGARGFTGRIPGISRRRTSIRSPDDHHPIERREMTRVRSPHSATARLLEVLRDRWDGATWQRGRDWLTRVHPPGERQQPR